LSLLLKSKVGGIDCNHCYRWMYNLETGEPITYEIGEANEDGEVPKAMIERTEPPPCSSCPKGQMNGDQPDFEGVLTLNRRSHLALKFYHEQKAMPMMPIPPHFAYCPIFAENMRTIHSAYEEAKMDAMRKVTEDAE